MNPAFQETDVTTRKESVMSQVNREDGYNGNGTRKEDRFLSDRTIVKTIFAIMVGFSSWWGTGIDRKVNALEINSASANQILAAIKDDLFEMKNILRRTTPFERRGDPDEIIERRKK